nr:MAG TPA_asm: hypothetical protein [Caudoviricetes sp.]
MGYIIGGGSGKIPPRILYVQDFKKQFLENYLQIRHEGGSLCIIRQNSTQI